MADRAPRTTAKEHERRVALVKKMLSARMAGGDIKRIASAQFGVAARTIEKYMCRAREEMLAESGKSRAEHRADAYAFYCSVISNPNVPDRDKVKAQERIDKLLGLESPLKVAPTDIEGNESYGVNVMREMMEMAEQYANAGQTMDEAEIASFTEQAIVETD